MCVTKNWGCIIKELKWIVFLQWMFMGTDEKGSQFYWVSSREIKQTFSHMMQLWAFGNHTFKPHSYCPSFANPKKTLAILWASGMLQDVLLYCKEIFSDLIG